MQRRSISVSLEHHFVLLRFLIFCLNSWICSSQVFRVKLPSSLGSCFTRLSPSISGAALLALLKAWNYLIWIWRAPLFLFSWCSLLLQLPQAELLNLREANTYFRASECISWDCSALKELLCYFLISIFLLTSVLSSGVLNFRFLQASDHGRRPFRVTKTPSL